MIFSTPAWDRSLFFLVNDAWRNDILDELMPVVSNSVVMWGLAAACFAIAARRSGQWKPLLAGLLLIAIVAGLSDLACQPIKKEFKRVRPLNAMASVHYVDDGEWMQRPADFQPTKTKGQSFVSAHAANSMAAAGMAALLWKRVPLMRLILLLPLLIGYSRLYLGKHYPSDVMGGWLVGLAVLMTAWFCVPERVKRYVRAENPAP
ncbi:phosphatase PAP2 family protein [Desulfovibrio mangrovi]|uniref:phosphatase PAP2 family protein n=1 Tax=Desulfovibrio mangrovi TaxID=2976983 RepID=UPI002246D276|nr:phosphatase PAP2 family protein [Desulfovibrio mangrovi]UZP66507.1 phosphatase PAP2 family protein [Desulfovibrio mangrovi]